MIVKAAGWTVVDSNDEMSKILEEKETQISQAMLVRAVRAFNAALGEIRSGWQPQLPLELALIESTRPLQDAPPEKPVPSTVKRESKSAAKPAPTPEMPPAPVEETAPVG